MCGIFGLISKSPNAPEVTFKGLLDIEYRGYDSWGIAFPVKDHFKVTKRIGFLPKQLKVPSATIAIGHTRWATHGGVTELNAHPHTDCSGKLVLVHNGIVENFIELKKSLGKHKFKSQTDTEVIIHLIEEEHSDFDLIHAVYRVFKKLEGLNALVVSDGQEIIACKKGSPLVVGVAEDKLLIASDPNALLPHTQKLLFLEDNQLVRLNTELSLFNALTLEKLTIKYTEVDWSYSKSSLNNFPHFMLKEISEQPAVLRIIAQNQEGISTVSDMIKKSFGTYLIGCGTASYACLAGVYLFSKIAKKHVNFSVGSEFTYIEDYLTPRSLLIAVSQSGETIDILEPVKGAKAKGSKIVSLVNVLGSSLYRESNYPVLLQAGVEKGVASTKAFAAMLANIILLAYCVSGDLKAGTYVLSQSIKEVESVLKREKLIVKLSKKIKGANNMFVLGRGLSYPIALEAAMKIKEVSYIHAEGFAGGELKHGVIALVDKGTPVICFVPDDETKGAMLSNAMEVKSRGAFVIGVAAENNPAFDFFFEVKDVGASSILPNVVFAQLLGYYLAIARGKNPDKPRNLAKSVVVR